MRHVEKKTKEEFLRFMGSHGKSSLCQKRLQTKGLNRIFDMLNVRGYAPVQKLLADSNQLLPWTGYPVKEIETLGIELNRNVTLQAANTSNTQNCSGVANIPPGHR